jgi:hypothetical protein
MIDAVSGSKGTARVGVAVGTAGEKEMTVPKRTGRSSVGINQWVSVGIKPG